MRFLWLTLLLIACGEDASNEDPGTTCGAPGERIRDRAELVGCNTVLGSVDLSDQMETTLRGLESIRVIEEDLSLFRNEQLVDTSGLANLERVGGTLTIRICDKLTSLTGLRALRSVGRLTLTSNALLPPSEADAFVARVKVAGESAVDDNGYLLP